MRRLRPAEFRPSIFHLDLPGLHARGIRGLMVDLDNTLVAWRYPQPTPAVRAWVEQARAAGLSVCIVSNGGRRRVEVFAAALGVPAAVSWAKKPLGAAFRSGLAVLGLEPGVVAVVGDQIFTDVLGGNRLGCYTILVSPVSRREFAGTRLLRMVERWVLAYLKRHGLLV